ncbi:MAG: hypothetical protein WBG86_10980 [Polyangiales bacterium]
MMRSADHRGGDDLPFVGGLALARLRSVIGVIGIGDRPAPD